MSKILTYWMMNLMYDIYEVCARWIIMDMYW